MPSDVESTVVYYFTCEITIPFHVIVTYIHTHAHTLSRSLARTHSYRNYSQSGGPDTTLAYHCKQKFSLLIFGIY